MYGRSDEQSVWVCHAITLCNIMPAVADHQIGPYMVHKCAGILDGYAHISIRNTHTCLHICTLHWLYSVLCIILWGHITKRKGLNEKQLPFYYLSNRKAYDLTKAHPVHPRS